MSNSGGFSFTFGRPRPGKAHSKKVRERRNIEYHMLEDERAESKHKVKRAADKVLDG